MICFTFFVCRAFLHPGLDHFFDLIVLESHLTQDFQVLARLTQLIILLCQHLAILISCTSAFEGGGRRNFHLFNLFRILFQIQNLPSLPHQHFRQRGWSQLATMPATWTVRGYCLLLLATLLLYDTVVDKIYEVLINSY